MNRLRKGVYDYQIGQGQPPDRRPSYDSCRNPVPKTLFLVHGNWHMTVQRASKDLYQKRAAYRVARAVSLLAPLFYWNKKIRSPKPASQTGQHFCESACCRPLLKSASSLNLQKRRENSSRSLRAISSKRLFGVRQGGREIFSGNGKPICKSLRRGGFLT